MWYVLFLDTWRTFKDKDTHNKLWTLDAQKGSDPILMTVEMTEGM